MNYSSTSDSNHREITNLSMYNSSHCDITHLSKHDRDNNKTPGNSACFSVPSEPVSFHTPHVFFFFFWGGGGGGN